jgi:hypothetical protein
MTKHSGGATINQGRASKPTGDERDAGIDVARNVAETGGPSPGNRQRGETTDAEAPAPVDLDTAHDRAS